MYIYIPGADPGFEKGGGVCLSILNWRFRRRLGSEAPKALRGKGVGRGALPT